MRPAHFFLLISLALAFLGSVLSISLKAAPWISGYYEPSFRAYDLKTGEATQVENRLRTDLKADVTPGVALAADVIFQAFSGLRTLDAADFLPERFAPLAVWIPQVQFEDRFFLDNAYVSFSSKRLDLRVGRQPLAYGAAYLYNPIDMVNVKQTFDPTYEKPGVDALRVVYYYRGSGSLELTVLPADKPENWGWVARTAEHLVGFDLSLTFGQKQDTLIISPERRQLLGFSAVGSLLGSGLWGEAAYNWMEDSRDFADLAVGMDYTLSSGLYLMGEYYRHELGGLGADDYELSDWIRVLNRGDALSRDRLFLGGSYPFADLWKGALYGLINLNDRSFALNPWVYWSVKEDVEIDLTASLPWGDEGTEFGEIPRVGLLRLRLYY